MANLTTVSRVVADGVDVFYREAGSPDAPTILLLHGFPSSSHQFRNLIPLLAMSYHVLAPDFPSFGFTTIPTSRSYEYTFDNLACTTTAFLDALHVDKFAMYIFDYGAPVGLRIAMNRPESVTAIITQNGNAYVEGLGQPFWGYVEKYWASNSTKDRDALIPLTLTYNATKTQYVLGAPSPDAIEPESYTLDWALLQRPGIIDIQLDLFYDYRTNVALYPKFQEYFRNSQVPLLAVWGKYDQFFVPAGAEAYKRDLPNAEIHLIEAAHFAVEEKTEEIADLMKNFLGRNGFKKDDN
ncbi:hypothetical protein MMC20_007935 [Loxospora ochrophaea]|nr:hypothetical protein [Loxospora ochrophaea]